MKVEIRNAYISLSVNHEPCRIPAELAYVHFADDGTVTEFEAKVMLLTSAVTVIAIGNRTRMNVDFNGPGQHSFIHSTAGQEIDVVSVEFLPNFSKAD